MLIDDVKSFNSKLHLCCLITYGCLLRPHREIRELKWKDFSQNLSYINLSGHRTKSGKNRVVPVPKYVREYLNIGNPNENIFTNSIYPYNQDYFKSLWTKYKIQSSILKEHQTLYSFRHSGAINIYQKTGSIIKLQKAMGHSSIKVSLTYLRGLEIPELEEDDMPMI